MLNENVKADDKVSVVRVHNESMTTNRTEDKDRAHSAECDEPSSAWVDCEAKGSTRQHET